MPVRKIIDPELRAVWVDLYETQQKSIWDIVAYEAARGRDNAEYTIRTTLKEEGVTLRTHKEAMKLATGRNV